MKIKRFLAFVVAFAMVMSIVPAMSLTASAAYTVDDTVVVDGVKWVIVGENLMTNGSFEDADGNFSLEGWYSANNSGNLLGSPYTTNHCYAVNATSVINNNQTTSKTTEIPDGKWALGTRWNDGTNGLCSFKRYVPVTAGKTYLVTYKAKHKDNNADGGYIKTSIVADSSAGEANTTTAGTVGTSWKEVQRVFTATDAMDTVLFWFRWLGDKNNTGNGPFWYFDDFGIYEVEEPATAKEIVATYTVNGEVVHTDSQTIDIAETDVAVFPAYGYSANGTNVMYYTEGATLSESGNIELTKQNNWSGKAIGETVTYDSKKYAVTSENLIPNGNFASGLTGWYNAKGGAATTSMITVNSDGTVTNKQNKGSADENSLYRTWAVTPGKTYIFTMTVDATVGNGGIVTSNAVEYVSSDNNYILRYSKVGENTTVFTAEQPYISAYFGWSQNRVFGNFGLYEAEEVIETTADTVKAGMNAISLPLATKTSITVPTTSTDAYGYESTIGWTSSNADVLANDGTVTAPADITVVTLTPSTTYNGSTVTGDAHTVYVFPASVAGTEYNSGAGYYNIGTENIIAAAGTAASFEEQSLKGWLAHTGQETNSAMNWVDATVDVVPDGDWAYAGWWNGPLTGSNYCTIDTMWAVEKGTYYLSFYAKKPAGGSKTYVYYSTDDAHHTAESQLTSEAWYELVSPTSDWAKYEYIIEATEAGYIGFTSYNIGNNGSRGTQFDDFELYTAVKAEEKVVSVETVTITVIAGNEPVLPATVVGIGERGSAIPVNVEWENADFSNAGNVTVIGTVEGYEDLTATATVTVLEKTFEVADLSSANGVVASSDMFVGTVKGDFAFEFDYVSSQNGDDWIYISKRLGESGMWGSGNLAIGVGNNKLKAPNSLGGNPEEQMSTAFETGKTYRFLVQGNTLSNSYKITITDADGNVVNDGSNTCYFRTNNTTTGIPLNYINIRGGFKISNVKVYAPDVVLETYTTTVIGADETPFTTLTDSAEKVEIPYFEGYILKSREVDGTDITLTYEAQKDTLGSWAIRNNVTENSWLTEMKYLGTHDSFADTSDVFRNDGGALYGDTGATSSSSAVINQSKAQTYGALDQLNMGVRYFDIRLSRQKDGSFATVHGPAFENFRDVATTIAQFAKENPGEVILLDFQTVRDGLYGGEAEGHDDVIANNAEKFGPDAGDDNQYAYEALIKLLTETGVMEFAAPADAWDKHYGEITNNGEKSVILLIGKERAYNCNKIFINRKGAIGGTYDEDISNYDDVVTNVENKIAAGKFGTGAKFGVVHAYTTPGGLGLLTDSVIGMANDNNPKWINEDLDAWMASGYGDVFLINNVTPETAAMYLAQLSEYNRDDFDDIYSRNENGIEVNGVKIYGATSSVPFSTEFVVEAENTTYDISLVQFGTESVQLTGKVTLTFPKASADDTTFDVLSYNGEVVETAEVGAAISYETDKLGTYTVSTEAVKPDVAQVGETKYKSLQEAIDAANAGDTVTVIADISDEDVVVNKNLTITGTATLTDVSITGNGTDVELTVSNLTFAGNSWINSGNVKKLTVSGVTANVTPVNGNGAANNATNSRSGFVALGSSEQNTLELVLENNNIVVSGGGDPVIGWAQITNAAIIGNTFGSADAYINNADAVKFMSIADGAVFTITGNTSYSNYNGFVFSQNTTRDNAYTVELDGNTFVGGADHIWVEVSGSTTTNATIKATSDNTVNGVAFTADDIKTNVATWTSYAGVDVVTDENGKVIGGQLNTLSNLESIADGYELDENGYVVEVNYVAEVDGVKYEDLQTAINAADGKKVTLLSDVELTESITVTGEVTLDLNGKTITYTSTTQGEAMITNKGTLTIDDSSDPDAGVINYNYVGAADSSYGKGNYTISNAGTLTVNGGKITIANLRAHAKYPIDNNSTTGDAILVINGGHLYNYNTSAIRQFCNSTTYKNSVTINGGLIEGYCAVWVQNPGKKTVNGSLSITGGEIRTTAAAYVNGTSELKDVASRIYCTIDGEGGAWSEDSAVSITGGTINENVYLAEEAPESLTVEGTAVFNGYVELPVPTGTITLGCTSQTGVWGELTSDAEESVVVELYQDDVKMASTTLTETTLLDGTEKTLTWTIAFEGEIPSWSIVWEDGYPNAAAQPTTVKLIVDGECVAENTVVMNGPDNLNPVVWEELEIFKNYVAEVDGVKYEDLQTAINEADGKTVTLLGDINLSETVKVAGKVTLDLNGCTITGTDNNETGNFALIEIQPGAELTIDDSSEEGTGKITLTAVTDRVWNAYSSVVSNQRGKLVVEDGTIEHLGGTSMAYGIDNLTNGTGTYAETVINDGTVKSTYRAIRQFLNGTEAENILTVNGGTIEGTNKSIWVQDPSAKANSGKITVSADATLVGDVYLSATTGSEEFPVEVAIAKAALSGESQVLIDEDISAIGYILNETDGVYGVEYKPIMVTYADGTVEYFDDMIEAVPYTTNYPKLEGATITLLDDVSGKGMRFMENDMVFDLNEHTFTITDGTGSQGTNTSGFQIRPEVTTDVIFKNGTINVTNAPVAWMFNVYATQFIVENVTIDCAGMAYDTYGDSCYVAVSRSGDDIQFTGTTKVINFNEEVAGNAYSIGGTMTVEDEVELGGTVLLGEGATLTAREGLDVVADEGFKIEYAGGTYTSVKDGLDGSGTAEDPFVIEDIEDFKWFRDDVNAGNTYAGEYVKVADNVVIDLNEEEWTPIGTSESKFQGHFDGNDVVIKNLVITGNTSYVGLFGYTANGSVKSLTVENAKVSGRLGVGVVAGSPFTTDYSDITVKGLVQVEGFSYVGGVLGRNAYGDITDITVDVDAESYVKATSTEYDPENEYADENGYVAYRTYVGGVIGFLGEDGHIVKDVTSNINVIGDVCDIGGIAGIAHYDNIFENVTCSGTVTNTSTNAEDATETGGLVGTWHNNMGHKVTFTNCSFTGKVVATGVAEDTAIGAAYSASNNTEETSGKLIVDGVQVWPVPALPTATVTELENENLTFALNFKADEATDAQLAYYGTWIADYVLKVNKDVTFNADSDTADGYLSGQYDAWSENWVNVPFEDVTLKAGESIKIMEYASTVIPGWQDMKLTYNDVYNFVKDFNCGVFLTDLFLAENPDFEVTLELRMYNPENEDESYVIGETYTFEAPEVVIDLPTATVTELENEDLTFALNFKADEATDAQLAYYGTWIADYVLKVNKDVTFNADSDTADGYLSGQYDAWSENWVNVPFEDVTLEAGESIKIMEYASTIIPGWEDMKLTYNDVYNFVKDFNCGVFLTDEFLAANPDFEVTLELRMYNPEDTSESYVIGETYEFVPRPTATVTEITNENLTFALNFKADEVTDKQFEYYKKWYADYVLTVNKDIVLDANGTGDGYLSGQYDKWSANWVDVPYNKVVTLKANEPLKIMEYAAELMGQPGLKVTYKDVYKGVKDFDCGMFLEPAFIAANPDLEVTLELRMYNNENEAESYTIGETYVFTVPKYVAEFNGEYFTTLQAAFDAVAEAEVEDVATITLYADTEEAVVVADGVLAKLVTGGKSAGTIELGADVLLTADAELTVTGEGLVAGKDSEGTKFGYTTMPLGLTMVQGAQVRVGEGVNEKGEVNGTDSGLRFITKVNTSDTLVSTDDNAEMGVVITAQGSEAKAKIKTEKWQEEGKLFTSALKNLAVGNFYRKFTATPYVVVDGIEFVNNDETNMVTRSIYQVAAGLLVKGNPEGDAGYEDEDALKEGEKLYKVLNAYVNQTGIRLVAVDGELKANTNLTASGAYGLGADELHFAVTNASYDAQNNVYKVTIEALGNAEIYTEGFLLNYIRINNNNKLVKEKVTFEVVDKKTVNLTFNAEGLLDRFEGNDNKTPDDNDDGYDPENPDFN